MRGYYVLAAIGLFIIVANGLPAQEFAAAKPAQLHTACPCVCGTCGDKCPCSYPNECAEMHWVAGGPDDPGYYLCTKMHVWGALYPDGKFRAYANGRWAAHFSTLPIAPPECPDGQCPTCTTACGCGESDCGPGCQESEACGACQGPSCGSCEAGPHFRTPIRTFFHRHRPVRRLLRWAFCGC